MINWEPTGRRVFFFEPHQDDGVLFMGAVAAHHVLAGREVHVVLMSNGSTSNVKEKLNGSIHSGPWWGGFHYPEHEGYAPLTPLEFGLARTREWSASWELLGVPIERQHFGGGFAASWGLPDSVSVASATAEMEYWLERSIAETGEEPGLYTTHWADANSDHAHLGQALRTLRLSDPAYTDSRWLCKPEQAADLAAQTYIVPANLAAEVKAMQKRASYPYGAWAPREGSFAVGYHSVFGAYFQDGPLAGAPNYIVRTP